MLKEYVVCLHDNVDYNSFWDAMENDSSFPFIPNRPVEIANEKIGMDRSCHYYLTDEEASLLTQDSRIYCVEIPVHLRDDIQIGRLAIQNGDFTKTNSSTGNYVNWGLVRVNSPTNIYGTANTTTANYGYNLDATGVDVVIQDSGIQVDHPEFTNRVQLVDWYAISGVAGTQNANHYRDYDGHGTHVAGIVAGSTYGWAKNARIYSLKVNGLEGTGDSGTGISITDCFNVIKNWHLSKPINQKTGFRRPTIVNMSWGYSSGYNSVTSVNYRGTSYSDGSTTSDANYRWTNYGIVPVSGSSTTYTSPVRVDSVDVDVQELVKAGVIVCIAAGNSYFKIDTPDGFDYNNYVVTNAATVYYHRGMSPYSNTAVIVGSIDNNSYSNNLDQKATYSNAGPGVDLYSPGSNVISSTSTTNIRSGVTYYANASYKQVNLSGTSMAAPQVVGMGALYLSMNPGITPASFKQWLKRNAASNVLYSSNVDTDYTNTRSIYSGNNYILYNPFNVPNNGTLTNTPAGYVITPSVTTLSETSSNVVVFTVSADTLGNETLYYTTNTLSSNSILFASANVGTFNIVKSANLTLQVASDRTNSGTRTFILELRRNSNVGSVIYTSSNVNVYDSAYIPGAPIIGTATASNSFVATIAFTANADTGGNAVIYYTATSNTGISANSATSPITIDTLSPNTSYTFVVTATNSIGTSANSGISNSISTPAVPPGSQSYTTSGSYSFIVPRGITSVSAVAVGGGSGGGGIAVSIPSSTFTQGTAGGNSYFCNFSIVGGGGGPITCTTAPYGGAGGGSGGSTRSANCTGGSGAGGYSGSGGIGGRASACNPATDGTGGGGAGGHTWYNSGPSVTYQSFAGGGVGILGQGPSGIAASYNVNASANAGSGGSGVTYGGGGGAGGSPFGAPTGQVSYGGHGGGLGWRNNISVTPGASIPVVVGAGGSAGPSSSPGPFIYSNGTAGGGGAVRIVWPGTTRLYPTTCVSSP